MSALAGLFLHGADRDRLQRMTAAMAAPALGPPDLWVAPDGRSGVAAAPLRGRGLVVAGGVAMAVDARIDNRRDLDRALGVAATESAALDDAGRVHRAYMRWGASCVEHLIGDFAIVAWDERAGAAFVALDQTGKRVLYYCQVGGGLAVVSEPKALFTLPGVGRRLNESKLAEHLVLVRDPATSFYEGIERLPAASALVADGHGVRLSRYWQLDAHRPIDRRSDHDHIEAFLEVFAEAVRCRLPSGSTPGVMLSGGLDSTSVAAVAASEMATAGRGVRGYTSVPDVAVVPGQRGIVFDETPMVEALGRRHPNLVVSFVRPEGRIPLDVLGAVFDRAEAPPMNPDNQVWMEDIHRLAAADGVEALLTGQAGNATISFSGLGLMADLARRGRWLKMAREVRARARSLGTSPSRVFEEAVLDEFLSERLRRFRRRLRGRRVGADDWREHSAINPGFAKLHDVEGRLAAREMPKDSREARALWAENLNGGAEIMAARRAIHGVEVRDPTGDIRVRELCLAMPLDQFYRHGVDRALVRRAMVGLVPDEVLQNRVRGRQAGDWHVRLSAARDRVDAEVRWMEQSDLARRVLDVPRLRHALLNWPERFRPDDATVYQHVLQRGLVMGAFLRWFEEGATPR